MASPSPSSVGVNNSSQISRSRKLIAIAFLLISALYFADTLLRASLKTFWYDELFTVYLCRLPSFHATWAAVVAGTDLNPPLFYLLTRWGQHFSGEGLIATRLPAILGFWIFCICLFIFVNRRLGPLYACVAALFPIFTLAGTYAYEARPYGCLLGWCGLMFVCWQRARERRSLSWWTLALGLSALAALLTHIYSVYLFVPFLAVEFLGLIKGWKFHRGAVAILLVTPIFVIPLYLRLLHTYRSGGPLGGLHIHLYEVIQRYLVAVMGPALALLLFFLLLLAIERNRAGNQPLVESGRRLLPEEIWLAAIMACLAVAGIIGAKIGHSPFMDRYFLAATAGYAILLAQAANARTRRAFAAKGLIAAMLFLLAADTAVAAFCRWHHADLDQVEPASHFAFPPSPHRPLQRDAALLRKRGTEDVLVTEVHTYLYLYYYAPADLRSRLYLGVPASDNNTLVDYQRDNHWMRLNNLRATSFADFFATHRDFYAYSPFNPTLSATPCGDCLEEFLAAGYTLRSVDRDNDNLLEHFSK